MGTLVIEEWGAIGTQDNPTAPVYRIPTGYTEDTTTSTSDESITLDGRTKFISVIAISGDHRIRHNDTAVSNTNADAYIAEGERRDIAVTPGKALYYESTA